MTTLLQNTEAIISLVVLSTPYLTALVAKESK